MISPRTTALLDAFTKATTAAAAFPWTVTLIKHLNQLGGPWQFLTRTRLGAIYLAIGLSVLVLVYRFSLLSDQGAPPGTDVGNWLALAHELFGERVKAAIVPYPPVVPGLVKSVTLVLPPLLGVILLGAVLSVVAGLPFFFSVRHSAGTLWALLFTVALLFIGYSVEMLAWGGYPQMLTQALLVLTLYWLGKGLLDNRRLYLPLAGVSAAASIGTSVLSLTFLAVTIPMFVALLAFQARLNLKDIALRVAAFGVVAGALSLAFLPVYLRTYELREGRIWNPQGYTAGTSPEAFAYVFKELPGVAGEMKLLLPLALVTIAYILRRSSSRSLVGPGAISMMATGLLLFFTSFEVRMLSIFEWGLLAGLAFFVSDGFSQIRRLHLQGTLVLTARAGIVVAALSLVAVLVAAGHQRTVEAIDWYLVLDRDVVEGLDWLQANASPGTLVAASTSPKGHQLAWLVEGYAGLPAYNGSDPRWLILKEERRQAAVARALLASASGEQAANIAEQHNIEYIILDKRVRSNRAALAEAGFVSVFENPTLQVLRAGTLQIYPAPPWWPEEGVTPDNALEVIPPLVSGADLQKNASYYRLWHLMAREALHGVVGGAEPYTGSESAQTSARASFEDLVSEIEALKQAEASSVIGDAAYPRYHFQLWQAFGRPAVWPPEVSDCVAATSISPPRPPSGVSTDVVQRWYACSRAKYATVYNGEEDVDPSVHVTWARDHDDAELYVEIRLLREAHADGVIGSRQHPFQAFEEWKEARDG